MLYNVELPMHRKSSEYITNVNLEFPAHRKMSESMGRVNPHSQ